MTGWRTFETKPVPYQRIELTREPLNTKPTDVLIWNENETKPTQGLWWRPVSGWSHPAPPFLQNAGEELTDYDRGVLAERLRVIRLIESKMLPLLPGNPAGTRAIHNALCAEIITNLRDTA